MQVMPDSSLVQWLRTGSLAVSAARSTSYDVLAIDSAILSPLALAAGAEAEIARQADILQYPIVKDRHRVPGDRRDLLGRCITLRSTSLGYAAGRPCFVIGYSPGPSGSTILTVVRRL